MQARTLGTTMPVLEVDLQPNESVFSESGELSWMTGSIQMTTHTQMGGGGGLSGVLKRVAGGGSIFMTEYRETFSNQFVAAGRRLVDDIIEPAETRAGQPALLDQIHHGQKKLPAPGQEPGQLLLVRFSLLAYRMVAFLHGGSSFQTIWQPDSFRTGLNRRSTFN